MAKEEGLGVERPFREVARVEGQEHVRPTVDGGGQDMDVVGIGEPQTRLGPRLGDDLGPGPAGAEQRDLAPRHGLLPCPEPRRGARPFLEDARRPERRELARGGDPQHDLPQDGRIEDAGVDQDAHQSSRKASALR
jgi:hypothetical protein